MRTINCEDCGAPRTTTMPNTKYCTVCRLLKNLNYVGERTGNCVACKKKHAITQRKPFLCATCETITSKRKGKCGVCGNERNLVWQDVDVCGPCMDDPDKRGRIMAGLLQKIARNQAEYATVDE